MLRGTVSMRAVNLAARVLVLAAGAILFAPFAPAQNSKTDATVSIQRKAVAVQAESEAAKYHTREGRLAAKPLDWNANLGKKASVGGKPKVRSKARVPTE